jgi:hypothetical protein
MFSMGSTTLEIFEDEAQARARLEAAELSGPFLDVSNTLVVDGTLLASTLGLKAKSEPKTVAGVLAQAMTRPAAVWWACRVAETEHEGGPTEGERIALDAAKAWLQHREQWRAYAAHDAAKQVGLDTPAGCAALAAFLAGESIGPSHLDPLPPGAHLSGMATAGAVELAVTRRPPSNLNERWDEVLALGFAIAEGEDGW